MFHSGTYGFLLFLELLVLTIKIGETPCDYDLMVEYQLSHKRLMLQKTEDSLRNLM